MSYCHTKYLYLLLLVFILLTGSLSASESAPAGRLIFDSTTSSEGGGGFIQNRVQANFIIERVPGSPGEYRGTGRLSYTELDFSGLPYTSTDGILDVYRLTISPIDGTVEMYMFPGDPKPTEWLIFPPAPPSQLFQWFGVFGYFHTDELDIGGFRIKDWEYDGLPEGMYARKAYSYDRRDGEVTNRENTIISIDTLGLIPRIDAIHQESSGQQVDKPETGEKVQLYADIFKPIGYTIERCTWTGNNFPGQGLGDPNNNCSWEYTPNKGPGPARNTYGNKYATLTIVYSHGSPPARGSDTFTDTYKVFFPKKKDDDNDNEPNWFDYWGDDGAVPELDDPDVLFDSTITSFGSYSRGTRKITLGQKAAETDRALNIPNSTWCPGVSLPEINGIDTTAVTLAHENKHKEIHGWTGTDTDGDRIPDASENGTNPNDSDSCNLAWLIHHNYATYGDNEFIARKAEEGVTGVAQNDWALPGKKSGESTAALSASLKVSDSHRGGIFDDVIQHTLESLDSSPQSILTGGYTEEVVDTDSDGLYNKLVISVGVDISEIGEYDVVGWLVDNNSTPVAWAAHTQALDAGVHIFNLEYDGRVLNTKGTAAPFSLSRIEVRESVGKHSELANFSDSPFVSSYGPTDFDPFESAFGNNISEQGIDTGSDGLYDQLIVTFELDVRDEGAYEISGELIGSNLAMTASVSEEYTVGLHNVELVFDGASIYQYREDGPYQLRRLQVRDIGAGELLDFWLDPLSTAAYLYDMFQNNDVVINPASYVETIIDENSDGENEILQIDLTGESFIPGPYTVTATLEDGTGTPVGHTTTKLGLGGFISGSAPFSVSLLFDGQAIHASGIDGPYMLSDVTILNDEGRVADRHPVAFTTATYSFTDFVQDASSGFCYEVDGVVTVKDKTYEGKYECFAQHSISTENSVSIGGAITADVIFGSGQLIRLQPGFRIVKGSQFLAFIDSLLLNQ